MFDMWIQNQDYLKWSRKILLPQSEKKRIADLIGLKSNFKILDVGCGSGELIFYLNDIVKCEYIGIDIDKDLIKCAKNNATSNMTFLIGNALNLPFEDSSFDLIISHTFLTAIFDAETAVQEFSRVCKSDGYIISLSSDSFNTVPYSEGFYENENWIGEYIQLKKELDYNYLKKANKFSQGLKPEYIPRFFTKIGLKNVSVNSIGRFFSTSNSNLTTNELKVYSELEYKAEMSRINLLPLELRNRYKKLLELKISKTRQLGNNIWNWYGGETILVKGLNNKDIVKKRKKFNINVIIDYLQKNKIEFEEIRIRSDLDSISSVKLQLKNSNNAVMACNETPSKALEKAYLKLFSKTILDIQAYKQSITVASDNIFFEQFLNDCNFSFKSYLNKKLSSSEFINYNDNQKYYCPDLLLQHCYSDLGISYGKTREEALKKGLLDIYAIYSIKELISENIKIKILNYDSIKKNKKLKNMLNILEELGYKMSFYNISDDNKIPVILLLTTKNGNSKINFCCDTDVELAIKEDLFSLINGRKIENLLSYNANIKKNNMFNEIDIFNLITNGNGIIPESILSVKEEVTNIDTTKTTTLNYIIEKFQNNKWELFIRECKYNNLIVMQVITPSIYKYKLTDEIFIEFEYGNNLKKVLLNFSNASDEEKIRVLKYMSIKQNKIGQNTFSYIADIPNNKYLFGIQIDYKILNALYLISKHQYDEAIKYIPAFNDKFKCLRDFLKTKNFDYIKQVYSDIVANEIDKVINDPFKCLLDGEKE